MVENRPWLNFFTHLILILGVVVVVFPVYVAFVASTQTAVEVEQAPMSLIPGTHLIENYAQILFEGGFTLCADGILGDKPGHQNIDTDAHNGRNDAR